MINELLKEVYANAYGWNPSDFNKKSVEFGETPKMRKSNIFKKKECKLFLTKYYTISIHQKHICI